MAEFERDDAQTVPIDTDGEVIIDEGTSQSVPIEMVISDCPNAKRLIGMLSSGSDCTLDGELPEDWTGAPLFEQGSPGVASLSLAMPGHFEQYCAFDYVGGENEIENEDYQDLFAAIEDSPDISGDSVSADCRGEFGQAGLYDPAVGAELQASFMANIDWEMGAQVDADYPARASIEVGVLDTVSQAVADDPQAQPADRHGLQIAALIDEISCPTGQPSCAAGLRHYMAMPREDWTVAPDWTGGGHHGTQGDLAMAVYEAVHSWRARREADPGGAAPRLVLNLSLGWHRLEGLSTDTTRGPAAALVSAMNYAACNEVLMVVAAGNTGDELCPEFHTGPLAPASFEMRFASPSKAECAELGFSTPTLLSLKSETASYRPLVHAVAAFNEHDEPLINAREGGISRVVALGANGIVDPGAEALAGSSVSAAVVSATAALLWSYRPQLDPHQVMELIYSSGWGTDHVADFQLGSDDMLNPVTPTKVRRVSVCAALDAACEGQGLGCPKLGCSATAPAEDGYLTGVLDATEAVLADPATEVEIFEDATTEQLTVCEPPENINNLSAPQPELPVCSRCNISKPPGFTTGDDSLSMTIDAIYSGEIDSVNLLTLDAAGEGSSQALDAEVVASLNAQPDAVDVTVALVEAGDAVMASLEFHLSDGSSQKNRIPVIEAQ